MKYFYTTIFICFTSIISVYSQTFIVTGTIETENGSPIEFANITLTDDNYKVIAGTVSEQNGRFEITVAPNNYILTASFIGYENHIANIVVDNNINFSTIRLKADDQMLEELTVMGQKALFERKPDRLVFNVEKSVTASGSNIMDALRIVPGIRVDNDQISMIARGNLIVTIDDRVIPLNGNQLTSYLLNISIENIQNIEVITNPPAKYDAEGNSGIINIVMKKAVNDSWNLSLRSAYQTRTALRPEFDSGINFNYRKNKFSLYAAANQTKGSTKFSWEQIIYYPTENRVSNAPKVVQKWDYFGGNIGFNYKITDSWQIGSDYYGWKAKSPWLGNIITTNYDNEDNQIKEYSNSKSIQTQCTPLHDANINTIINLDSLGSKVSIDFDFFYGHVYDDIQFLSDIYIPEQSLLSYSHIGNINKGDGKIKNYSVKIDLELPIQWINLNIGGRVASTIQNNDFRFYDTSSGVSILDIKQSNVFNFKENIHAAYISAQKEITKKFILQAGLRMEHTGTASYSQTINQKEQNSYTSFFPTGYLLYKFNDYQALSFNYGKRIKRPDFLWFNPFQAYTNPNEYTEGNPFLKPVFSDNYELSFTSSNFEHRIWYMNINDDISFFPFIDEKTQITRKFPMNFINYFSVGFSETYNFNKFWWWNSYNNAVIYYIQKNSIIPEALPKLETISSNINSNNDFMLNKKRTWILNFGLYYEFPFIAEFSKVDGYFNLSSGIRANLLDNNLIIGLTANDIANTARPMLTTVSNGINTTFQAQGQSQRFKISIIYKFGNRNISVESRNGGNQEEVRRF